jgi:hypothetical protein
MITFPTSPTLGQKYVGTNCVTYTWMGSHWSGVAALNQGTAEHYVDGGDAEFDYDINRDGILDGGTA